MPEKTDGLSRRWDKNDRGRPTFGTDPNFEIPAEKDQRRFQRRVKLQGSSVQSNQQVADKSFLGNLIIITTFYLSFHFSGPLFRGRDLRATQEDQYAERSPGTDPLPQICPGLENEVCGDQGSMSAKSLEPPGSLLTTFRLKSSDWQAKARSLGVRVVLVVSGSYEGALVIFVPPRSSSSFGNRVALTQTPSFLSALSNSAKAA
ncbi:hypothetical protein LA080_015963 [Diaporthe eres]|nr:hypothetical protein LA080_015963 [Diaporthe eres]